MTENARGLSATIPDEPMMKKYHEDRIKEANEAAEGRINPELLGTLDP